MTRKRLAASALIVGVMTALSGHAQDYDLVINNGRVMDPETQFDDVANVWP
jgi:N-acyl-D-glutamate deacylase